MDLNTSEDSDADENLEVVNCWDDSDSQEVFDNFIKNEKPVLKKYEVLRRSELICSMKEIVAKIANILFVSEPIARCLLNQFKWNMDELLNDYYNSGDLDKFFQSFGIDKPASVIDETSFDPNANCGICFTPISETEAAFLLCGHQFCANCCCQYFQAKIINDGEGNRIKCPEPDCKLLIDDETIMELIPENVKHRFEILISDTFVSSHPLIRWCRSTDCEYAIKVQKVEYFPVICKCGFESCVSCGELWHDSVTCALLKKWIQCSLEDAESYKWIQENAKKCPKCTINIEKNGGCNHMRCRSCNYEFCWLCMNNWRQHGNCNQFLQNEQNKSQKLVHYSSRYNNQIHSLKLEQSRLYSSVESKMKDLQGMADFTRNEVLFFKCAIDSLRRSRQLLISTYVFAYYSEKNNQLLIFEDNQRDLELATENLSWYLEQEITNECMVQIKQKLQEKCTYCDKRRSILLDHINEGYQKGYWRLPQE